MRAVVSVTECIFFIPFATCCYAHPLYPIYCLRLHISLFIYSVYFTAGFGSGSVG